MGQDKLNFDRPEEEIIAEAKERGYESYVKPLPWLKVGEFVTIGDHPCKVTEITTGKGGKHGKLGYNKCFAGLDVFTGEKRETHSYEYYSISVPFVEFKEYLIINLTFEGALTLMDEQTSEQRDDVLLPDGELGAQIREAFNSDDIVVTAARACRREAIVKFRRKIIRTSSCHTLCEPCREYQTKKEMFLNDFVN
ncbi:hypothetical protein PRIPAC_86096 [Pristionchus pacificus]|uniref:EIF-5a domain-containing protein n=1 Tax=Pristionchus pacificus TaxID=54126 RepID=A0A2A6BTT8_PRIPA|nr:hypothetical protein PRIPAC_86096 [Pristionchus pacificus]|eukprot:PDM69267.1 hypothetical protein PRIPAC_47569 [Pristionchus pacificus]